MAKRLSIQELYDIITNSITWMDDLSEAEDFYVGQIAELDLTDLGLGIIEAWNVYGEDIRNMEGGKYQDFAIGGNSGKWDFCPKNRIIIDWCTKPEGVLPTIIHESSEKYGIDILKLPYEQAHSEIANPCERIERAKQEKIDWMEQRYE
jgi:hypothetical protein